MKTATLDLGRFHVTVDCDNSRFWKIFRHYMSHYCHKPTTGQPAKTKAISLHLDIQAEGPNGKRNLPWTKAISAKRKAFFRSIDYAGGRAFVSYRKQDEEKNYAPWLFDTAFLQTLSLFFRQYGGSFLHSGLVARRGGGTLIVGTSGAGKSTLTTAHSLQGYEYFSDEHPLLLSRGKWTEGIGVLNDVRLTPEAVSHFKLGPITKWPKAGFKCLIPLTALPSRPSRSCRIDRVIFPQFHKRGSLRIERLAPPKVVTRLLRDDYFTLEFADQTERRLGEAHLDLLMNLSQLPSYAVAFGPGDIDALPERLSNL